MKQYHEFNKSVIKKMNTIFMNFNSNKTFNPHKLLLKLIDEIDLKRSDKYCCIKS